MAVVEGDLQTDNDARRVAATGAQAVQINTEGGCHLTSSQVQEAIKSLDLAGLNILFIENVGNLVCPAEFDVGEDCKITLLSVTEGDDKPEKYPLMNWPYVARICCRPESSAKHWRYCGGPGTSIRATLGPMRCSGAPTISAEMPGPPWMRFVWPCGSIPRIPFPE